MLVGLDEPLPKHLTTLLGRKAASRKYCYIRWFGTARTAERMRTRKYMYTGELYRCVGEQTKMWVITDCQWILRVQDARYLYVSLCGGIDVPSSFHRFPILELIDVISNSSIPFSFSSTSGCHSFLCLRLTAAVGTCVETWGIFSRTNSYAFCISRKNMEISDLLSDRMVHGNIFQFNMWVCTAFWGNISGARTPLIRRNVLIATA